MRIKATKTDTHPDTGIKFSEFYAPEYKAAVELAETLQLQSMAQY